MTINPTPMVPGADPDAIGFDVIFQELADAALPLPVDDPPSPDGGVLAVLPLSKASAGEPKAKTVEPGPVHLVQEPELPPEPVDLHPMPKDQDDAALTVLATLAPDLPTLAQEDMVVPIALDAAPIAPRVSQPFTMAEVETPPSATKIEQPVRRPIPTPERMSAKKQVDVATPELPVPAILETFSPAQPLPKVVRSDAALPEPTLQPAPHVAAKPTEAKDAPTAKPLHEVKAGVSPLQDKVTQDDSEPAAFAPNDTQALPQPNPVRAANDQVRHRSDGIEPAKAVAGLVKTPVIKVNTAPSAPMRFALPTTPESVDRQSVVPIAAVPEGTDLPSKAMASNEPVRPNLPIEQVAVRPNPIPPVPQPDAGSTIVYLTPQTIRENRDAPFAVFDPSRETDKPPPQAATVDPQENAILEPLFDGYVWKPTAPNALPARIVRHVFETGRQGSDDALLPISAPPVQAIPAKTETQPSDEVSPRRVEFEVPEDAPEPKSSLMKQDLAQTALPDRTGIDDAPSPLSPGKPDPTAPTAALSLTPAAREVVPQILHRFTSKPVKEGVIEVTLSPKELGQVRIEIHQGAEGAKITVLAERPETMDLIRRHSHELLTEFRLAGLPQATLSFGAWSGPSTGQGGAGANGAWGGSSGQGGAWTALQAATTDDQNDPPTAYPKQAVQGDGMILRI